MIELEFRAARPEDCDSYAKMFSKIWSWQLSAEYWHHKFFENPAGEHMAHIAVDKNTGEIVGSLACIPLRYRIKGKDVIASLTVDVGVLPEYRKHRRTYWGVYKPTEADQYERQTAFVQAVATPTAETIALHMMHFDPLCLVPVFSRPVTMKAILPQKLRGLLPVRTKAGLWGRTLSWRHAATARSLCQREGVTVQPVSEPDDRFDDLWRSVQDCWPIALIRDQQLLRWRYCKHPTRTYQILTAVRGESLIAYCVTDMLRRGGVSRGRIVDFLVHPDHIAAGKALLHHAAARLISDGADMLVGWFLPRKWWDPFLASIGMRYRPREERHIIVRPFAAEENKKELFDPECWYYTGADTDQL